MTCCPFSREVADMSRVSSKIHCRETDLISLQSVVNNRFSAPELVRRARVVLEYHEGVLNNPYVSQYMRLPYVTR